jgi:hypothetical protein
VRRTLYERQLALAALAALGLLGALAVNAHRRPPARLPAAQGSYSALAGARAAPSAPRLTDCDVPLGPTTEGIENPVLPCGVRLYLSYRGTTVLASVIGHEPVPAGREFELTSALARSLGLNGVGRVGWSYAAAAAY